MKCDVTFEDLNYDLVLDLLTKSNILYQDFAIRAQKLTDAGQVVPQESTEPPDRVLLKCDPTAGCFGRSCFVSLIGIGAYFLAGFWLYEMPFWWNLLGVVIGVLVVAFLFRQVFIAYAKKPAVVGYIDRQHISILDLLIEIDSISLIIQADCMRNGTCSAYGIVIEFTPHETGTRSLCVLGHSVYAEMGGKFMILKEIMAEKTGKAVEKREFSTFG